MHIRTRLCIAYSVACAFVPLVAVAQPSPAPELVSPAASTSERFVSAFEAYKRYDVNAPMVDWREANAVVGRLGGHAGQLSNRQAPSQGQSAPHDFHRHAAPAKKDAP